MDLNIQEVFMNCVKIWYKEYLKYANILESNSAFSSIETKNSTKSFMFRKLPKETKESTEPRQVEINKNSGCSC